LIHIVINVKIFIPEQKCTYMELLPPESLYHRLLDLINTKTLAISKISIALRLVNQNTLPSNLGLKITRILTVLATN
jgi:hypothetical protein